MPTRSSLWLRALTIVLAVASLLALPPLAGAARTSKVITVRVSTDIQMKGSDIYCTVLKEASVGTSVACFHDPGGPSSSVRKGYAVDATEPVVVVEPSGSTKPVVVKRQPSFAKYPVFSGGRAFKSIVTLGVGDVAAIGGTHMAITVEPAKGGGNAIGVLYLDGNSNPIVGSYTVGISNNFVTVVKVESGNKTSVTYRHKVY